MNFHANTLFNLPNDVNDEEIDSSERLLIYTRRPIESPQWATRPQAELLKKLKHFSKKEK
jgi:hypothetical protein